MKDLKEYQEKAHQSINKLFNEIDTFKKKGEKVTDDTSKKINAKMAELNTQKENLKMKYEKLSNASENASEDAKKGFEDAKDSLETTWSKVKSEFAS